MNKKYNSRNGLRNLYNPKEEGIGAYDLHYINGYKNRYKDKNVKNQTKQQRKAA